MTVTIEIPALDRLCAWLEGRDKADVVNAVEEEIVAKLEATVKGGVPRPEFKEVPAGDDHPWKEEATQKAQEGPKELPKAQPTNVTPVPAAPAPAPKAATLADVQKAAAQMRDEGRLNQVTGLFGEFGIKKLSDLKGDALLKFAERLRQMGAKI
jgi:hypothetical protein